MAIQYSGVSGFDFRLVYLWPRPSVRLLRFKFFFCKQANNSVLVLIYKKWSSIEKLTKIEKPFELGTWINKQ